MAENTIGDRTIDEYVHRLEETGFHSNAIHFKPQYYFVESKDGKSIDVSNILCQEDWEEGTDRLAAAIGHNNGFPQLRTSQLLSNAHESCSDLAPDTVAAIERLYKLDYCLFGYSPGTTATLDADLNLGMILGNALVNILIRNH